jgi:hypothetical protein
LLPAAAPNPDAAARSPAVIQLVASHSLLPAPSAACLNQAADAVKGAGMLSVAAAALLASGTLGPVVGFIGASVVFAAGLAKYKNCEDEAAENKQAPKPK